MIGTHADLLAVLTRFNPWWSGAALPEVPLWRRAAFGPLLRWSQAPPAGRALLLSGARQVGKTTLQLQLVRSLLDRGVPANNILYVTFDHPLLKLASIEEVLRTWRELAPAAEGPEYLLLDEIQAKPDWQVWLKHQVDFEKGRRIVVTGSATPLVREKTESGVGRWQTLRIATLSFYEFLQIRDVKLPDLPSVTSLHQLFGWSAQDFARAGRSASDLGGHFHEYLLRGGFPQSARVASVEEAQRLLREDIVDKVLKRDMTALFGVRRVVQLEQVFLYLCLHDGGILNLPDLCKNLELKRPTVENFVDLLEAAHLIYQLKPLGYGKEVLRGRCKIYLADPALSSSVLLRGKSLLQDDTALGLVVETACFRHLFGRYYREAVGFAYWRNRKGEEVDIVAELRGEIVPFEIKYRRTQNVEYPGLLSFLREKQPKRAYILTRDLTDFRIDAVGSANTPLLRIPAALACYWLGAAEVGDGEADRLPDQSL
jgi:predicted AAA+ superfamily ATPase